VHPVKLPALMATETERTHNLTVGTQNFPNHVVFAVGDQQVFLPRIIREGDTPHRAVTYDAARLANQDRCEGRQPRPLRRIPNGRGRGAATDVRRHPIADRPAASATRASMSSAVR